MIWSTTQIDDESHDQETNNRDDLNTSEDELGFSVDLDSENV